MVRSVTDPDEEIRVDFHTHILPHMDDGAADCAVSLRMLRSLERQRIGMVCLTPHYIHHRESIDHFLERRRQSFLSLQEAIGRENAETLPALRLGAEVRVEPDLIRESGIRTLCYGETDWLLMELPYCRPEPRICATVENIAMKHGITPVIAHFDRYRKLFDREDTERILSIPGVVAQINAEALDGLSGRRFVFSLIRREVPVLLGSDAHDTESRPPLLAKAYRTAASGLKDGDRAFFFRAAAAAVSGTRL